MSPNATKQNPIARPASIAPLDWLVLTVALVGALGLVWRVIWYADRGYDFSDEGYYLNSIAHPHLYGQTVTQFGFIYHPLYWLVGESVALLRRVNLLITLGLAWGLAAVLLLRPIFCRGHRSVRETLPLAAVAFVLSTSALMVLRMWMPTPNYNTLALQALLIAGIGIVTVQRTTTRGSVGGWILIGISGWLAFMAKPTSAIALGAVVGLYVLAAGKFNWRLLGTSVATALVSVVISAWFMDASIEKFVSRIVEGVEDSRMQQGKHTLAEALRFDWFILGKNEKFFLLGGTVLLFIATHLCGSVSRTQRLCGISIALVFSFAGLALLGGWFPLPWTVALVKFYGVQFLSVPLAAVLAGLAVSLHNTSRLPSRGRIAQVLAFASLPHVYAFGTDDNYWISASWAAFFWIGAAVIALGCDPRQPKPWSLFLPIATGAQLCTITLIFFYWEHPYRQTQSVRQNGTTVYLGTTQAPLQVSPDFAEYLSQLNDLAERGGFRKGSPMLDLTGHYPGALYALGATPIGRPWMIGGYLGSEELAIAALDRVSAHELKAAWVLTEPKGIRAISPTILKRYGLDLAKDYVEVGTLESPTGTYPDRYRQYLLKPAP